MARSFRSIFLGKGAVIRPLQVHEGWARASLLALPKNLPRNHFPPNGMVTAKPTVAMPAGADWTLT
ncbi:MAG: hypothetical protein ACREFR_08070 [Limisphaerales bacterium]